LQDFGLDLDSVAVLGAGGWTLGAAGAKQFIAVTSNNLGEKFMSALQRMIENNTPKINQTGTWPDENGEKWNYFMHGGGCRLSNLTTGEEIDWDCPNVKYFDIFKFSFHLKWQMDKFPEKYTNLIIRLKREDLNSLEQNLIPELVNEGKLLKNLITHYRVA
jgi:hypothetical protein